MPWNYDLYDCYILNASANHYFIHVFETLPNSLFLTKPRNLVGHNYYLE